jgi:hypothetical protein
VRGGDSGKAAGRLMALNQFLRSTQPHIINEHIHQMAAAAPGNDDMKGAL